MVNPVGLIGVILKNVRGLGCVIVGMSIVANNCRTRQSEDCRVPGGEVRSPDRISTGANVRLCSRPQSGTKALLNSHPCHDMTTTRSSAKNLNWALESALQQLKDEVERVCAANGRTEKQLQSLMSRLDDTKVCFVLSACMCSISQ
jgi:hypothetical protein